MLSREKAVPLTANSELVFGMKRSIAERCMVLLLTAGVAIRAPTMKTFAWCLGVSSRTNNVRPGPKLDAQAGSFFNPVPERSESDEEIKGVDETSPQYNSIFDPKIDDVLQVQRSQSKATEPSTINGIPTSQTANDAAKLLSTTVASILTDASTSKPYVGVGPASLNDVTNPEYDDQGYTLYADERTGEKSRVFEALVEYPCLFTLKVVGANEGDFVTDILVIVAATCQVDDHTSMDHTVKHNGKWTSVTIKAPVQSAQMLYQLYEDVDRDPRVKFKF